MSTTALQWLPTEQLCQQLCISRSALFKLKGEGVFEPGTHYRQIVSKAPLAWDLYAVDALLRQITKAEIARIDGDLLEDEQRLDAFYPPSEHYA
jgi:hypothetical protein